VAGKSGDSGERSDRQRIAEEKLAFFVKRERQFAACPDPRDDQPDRDGLTPSGWHIRRHGATHFDQTEIRTGIGSRGSVLKSLRGECGRPGRCAGFKGIARLAALALEVPQDTIDNARLSNNGDNLHLGPADAGRGSISKIFLNKPAQVRRVSLANSESCSSWRACAAGPAQAGTALQVALARLL
jgi:hypothetical protein